MARWPMRLALGAAFGERGYGLPAGGTPESLARLGAAGVSAWYQATFATRRTLVAAGRFDATRAAETLVRVLAGPDVLAGDGLGPEWGRPPAGEGRGSSWSTVNLPKILGSLMPRAIDHCR